METTTARSVSSQSRCEPSLETVQPGESRECHRQAISDARAAGSRGAASRQATLAQGAADALDKLDKVRHALTEYYNSLDRREHGGVAAGAALNAIESALNMSWDQHKAAKARN